MADAYADAARLAGHTVETVTVADLDFPLLRSKADWEDGSVPLALAPVPAGDPARRTPGVLLPTVAGRYAGASHIKGFLEQVARPGFAISKGGAMGFHKLLKGRSARLVVTMGMPALVYRWLFRAHSVKALERNILGFVGIAPVHETLLGMVEGKPVARVKRLKEMACLGALAD